MSFNEPTFEEYKSATAWARFKYKYGIIVLILCWLSLCFIIYYMYSNGEAIASHPLIYGAEKYDVTCECKNSNYKTLFFVNGSTIWAPESYWLENIPENFTTIIE